MDGTPTYRGLLREWAATLYREGPYYLWYVAVVMWGIILGDIPYKIAKGDVAAAMTALPSTLGFFAVVCLLVIFVHWRHYSNPLQRLFRHSLVGVVVMAPAVVLAAPAGIVMPVDAEAASKPHIWVAFLTNLGAMLSPAITLWLVRHNWLSLPFYGSATEQATEVNL